MILKQVEILENNEDILTSSNFEYESKWSNRGWTKKSTQGQNFAINEKSTIVVQSLRNLVKIFISWVLYVASISAGLDQNCGFFINSKVLGLCTFFLFTLYIGTRDTSSSWTSKFCWFAGWKAIRYVGT